ncbi:hypothetical protein EVAR_69405_1 [Eumeta japonica]|uniref:Uncharacterized protein n=1 Tax=Eumeta variegata TaxID=151549 RepID=A0A4C2A1R7_EUMVA|nr:hypothetical protein EVAR_69405_1 [Eumeta japonica]
MSRAVNTPAYRLAAFGEAIIEVQLSRSFSGFQPYTTRVHECAGMRYAFFTSSSPQEEKKVKASIEFIIITSDEIFSDQDLKEIATTSLYLTKLKLCTRT